MSQFPTTTSAVVKTFMFPITWPPTTCPSLSERAAWRCPSSARVPTSETISCLPSTSIIWLRQNQSQKSYNVSLLQLAQITNPGEKNWYGIGEWGKKLKHWLKLLAISTHKIDFAFDGSQIQTCGEVGVDFHTVSYISTPGDGGAGGGVTRQRFILGESLPGSQTTYPFIYNFRRKRYPSPLRIPSTDIW